MPAQTQIFDPEITESEEDETELLLEAVGDAVRIPGGRPLSFREGEFKAGGLSVKIFRVLFDTGALHKSYISAEIVEQHREEWSQFIFPHRAVACLADQTTKVETKEIIRGTLSFVGEDGVTEYHGQVAERVRSQDPGLYPSSTVRGRESYGIQDFFGYRYDEFVSSVSADRDV